MWLAYIQGDSDHSYQMHSDQTSKVRLYIYIAPKKSYMGVISARAVTIIFYTLCLYRCRCNVASWCLICAIISCQAMWAQSLLSVKPGSSRITAYTPTTSWAAVLRNCGLDQMCTRNQSIISWLKTSVSHKF